MKKLIFIFSFYSLTSIAAECPQLAGTFHCSFSNDRYSPLKIEQNYSPIEDIERVTYTFTYTAFSNTGEVFSATSEGEYDGQGWITRCYKQTLRSIPTDASMMGEILIDQKGAFVRKLNGKTVQRCPRKITE